MDLNYIKNKNHLTSALYLNFIAFAFLSISYFTTQTELLLLLQAKHTHHYHA